MLTEHADDVPARTPARARRQRVWIAVAVVASISVIGLWLAIPWEWSLIDDPGQVLALREAIQAHGPVGGPIQHIGAMAAGDVEWGLFRPSYWVYPSLVYVLPIGPAHVVRLAMLVVALTGPLVALRRQGARPAAVVMAGLVLATASFHLYAGLINVSLQELSGAAFVGLGLMSRRHGVRIAMWVVAAWFKSPFSWLLIGEGIVLWRQGRRRSAFASLALAVGTLAAAAIMAEGGTYTARYPLDLSVIHRIVSAAPQLVDFTTVLLTAALVSWFVISRTRPHWNSVATVMLIGLIGYTIQMLPWGVQDYYAGGIGYLLGVLLTSLFAAPIGPSPAREAAALLVPLLAAGLTILIVTIQTVNTNATLRGITDCLVTAGSVNVLLDSGPEASVRIVQNAQLADPTWAGSVTLADEAHQFTADTSADVFIYSKTEPPAITVPTTILCDLPQAQVVRVTATTVSPSVS